jgi:hypothetical protein
MTPSRFLNAEQARSTFDPALVDRLAVALTETDPVGDAIVDACRTMPGGSGMRAINTWLEGGERLPTQLAELLEPITDVPEWVDWERIQRASTTYWRAGLWTGLALNCASLAAGYRSGASVKPLVLTGRLTKMAYRRQQETARWFLAATSPGALRREREGFRETVRVRIIHAHVRRRILESGKWRTEEWGLPINQADTAYGIAGEFSTVPVGALRDLGIHYSQAERDDIQHMWRYISHLLGVPDDLQAPDEQRALTICQINHLTDTPADDDSRALVKALVESGGTPPELLLPRIMASTFGGLVQPTLYGLIRHWAGDAIADELAIPDTLFKHVTIILKPAVKAGELIRRAGLRDEHTLAAKTLARAREVLDAGDAPAGIVTPEEHSAVALAA